MNCIPRGLNKTAAALLALSVLAVAGCGGGRDAGSSGRAPKPSAAKAANGPAAKPAAKPQPQPKPETEAAPNLIIENRNVTLRWIEKGVVRMSATAQSGSVNEMSKTAVLYNFSADLYENGKLTTSMSAPKVLADTQKRIVTATGGVNMKSLDRKTTLKAQWVKWYARQQKVIGDGGVNVKSDTWDVNGAAFVADTALKSIKVTNSAKGLIP